jgi:hypothetical protein
MTRPGIEDAAAQCWLLSALQFNAQVMWSFLVRELVSVVSRGVV